MKIRVINTLNRKDVNQFIQFPFELYKGHPCWVPPLVKEMAFNLNRKKHPAYEQADVDYLVAESEGQTLMQAQKRTKRLILNGMDLLPEYQGMGGTVLLYAEIYKTGKPMRFRYAETVQVDENNFLSWSEHEYLKIDFHKTHRNYITQVI